MTPKIEEHPERFRRLREWEKQLWGGVAPTEDIRRKISDHVAQMVTDPRLLPAPDAEWMSACADAKKPGCRIAGNSFPISTVDNPSPNGSFGYASAVYKVDLPETLNAPAELIIPLQKDLANQVHVKAVRVFRWDEKSARFRLVSFSTVNREGTAAWARTDESGSYVAIGYPRDPVAKDLVELLRRVSRYEKYGASKGQSLGQRICETFLASEELRSAPVAQLVTGLSLVDANATETPRRQSRTVARQRDAYLKSLRDKILAPARPAAADSASTFSQGLPEWQLASGWIPVPDELHFLQWFNIGPENFTCVVRGLAVDPQTHRTVYAAAEYGGVWKTVDAGVTWIPTMDGEATLHCDAVVVSRSVPSVVYAGTTSEYAHAALYRSSDGAGRWTRMSEVSSGSTQALAVHPTAPNTVYLAGNYGLHCTTDGGLTWKGGTHTVDGIAISTRDTIFGPDYLDDVKLDVFAPETIYIAVKAKGIFKTTDGGVSWRRLGANFEFTVKDDDGNIVRVKLNGSFRTLLSVGEDRRSGKHGSQFVAAKVQGSILVSYDGGSSWRQLTQDAGHDNQNFWASCIAVCPTDEDFIVAGGDHIDFTKNASAASPTWQRLANSFYVDQQAIAFSLSQPSDFYFSNDGFIGNARLRAKYVFRVSNGLVASQSMSVAVSQSPDAVVGCATFHTGLLRTGRTRPQTWEVMVDAENGPFMIDSHNPLRMYCSPWFTSVLHSTDGGLKWMHSNSHADCFIVHRPGMPELLFSDGAGAELRYSTNYGADWKSVSRTNGTVLKFDPLFDPSRPGCTALAFSPSDPRQVYLGTFRGNLWYVMRGFDPTTADGWRMINPPLPPVPEGMDGSKVITALAVHLTNPDVIYLGYSAFGVRPVWRGTRLYGNTFWWTDVSGLMPSTSLPNTGISDLLIDPWHPNRMFVATAVGVFVTEDWGGWWKPASSGLPAVMVTNIALHRPTATLFISTWGRGCYQSLFRLDE